MTTVKNPLKVIPEEKCIVLYQYKNNIYRKEIIINDGKIHSEYVLIYKLKSRPVSFFDEEPPLKRKSERQRSSENKQVVNKKNELGFTELKLPEKRKPGRPKGSKNKPKE